jgi:phage major head subunit gpT-like protein
MSTKREDNIRLSGERGVTLSSDVADAKRFRMLAYTGVKVGRFWGDVVIDLKGIERDTKMAMLLEHNDNVPVGVADKHTLDQDGYWLEGSMLSNPDAARVVQNSKDGLPYKASIGIRFMKTEDVAEGAETECNGQKLKGPVTVVRQSRLFETSFITCNPADLGTKAEVFKGANMADVVKDEVAVKSPFEVVKERVAEFKADPVLGKRPEFASEAALSGKTLIEARADLSELLLKDIETKAGTDALKAKAGSNSGAGFSPSDQTGANRFVGQPLEVRARIEVQENPILQEIFRGTPDNRFSGEKLYETSLKYETRRRADGKLLYNPRTVADSARELKEEADGRFGPINSDRLSSWGKSGADYSVITVKGFLGVFMQRFEDEISGIWAPRLGMRVESNQETETYRFLGMFPQLTEWLGGVREDNLPLFSFTLTNKLYRTGIAIDKQDFKFQKFGLITQKLGEAGAIVAEHWNELVTTLITGNGTAYDGQAFFATTHTLGGSSGTMTNALTSADYPELQVVNSNAPTADELNAIILAVGTHGRRFLANNGVPINGGMKSVIIMVPQHLESKALAAVRGARLNMGQDNPLGYGNLTFEVIVNPRLTTLTDIFFFREDTANKPFILQEPGAPEVLFQGPGSHLEWLYHRFGYGIETTRAAGYGAWECAWRARMS